MDGHKDTRGIQRSHCSKKESSSTGDRGAVQSRGRLFDRQRVIFSGSLEGLSARSLPVSSVSPSIYTLGPGDRRRLSELKDNVPQAIPSLYLLLAKIPRR